MSHCVNPTTFSAYFFCFAFQCSLNLYFAQFSEIRTTFVNCVMTEYKSTPKISLCSKIVELFALLSKTLVLLYYSYPDYIFIHLILLPDYMEPPVSVINLTILASCRCLIFKSPGFPFLYFYKRDCLAFSSR